MLQTMKQRYKNNTNNNNNRDLSTTTTCSSSSSFFYKEEEVKKEEEDLLLRKDDELEVAEILLQLHHLISKYDTSPLLVSWGVKRKRSALDWNPSSPPISLNLPIAIPSSSSMSSIIPYSSSSHHHHHQNPVSVSVFVDKREEEQPPIILRVVPKKKIESTSRRSSPATPLSFSPSESDSIRKPYKRKLSTNKKKTKEEWQTDVIMLADQQDTLKKELRKVMDYYENLKAKNLELKLTLQKVRNQFHQKDLSTNLNSYCNGKEGGLDLCLEQAKLVLPSTPSPVPPEQVIQNPVPMVVVYQQQTKLIIEQQQQQHKKCIRSNELLENSRYSYNHHHHQIMPPPPPSASHLQSGVLGTGFRGMDQNANPRGLPDLNFTDASSTVAAEAEVDETRSSNGFEYLNPNYNYIHQQQQQHWFESSSLNNNNNNNNNRAAAEARRRRMEEMRKGKRSMDSIKTRCR